PEGEQYTDQPAAADFITETADRHLEQNRAERKHRQYPRHFGHFKIITESIYREVCVQRTFENAEQHRHEKTCPACNDHRFEVFQSVEETARHAGIGRFFRAGCGMKENHRTCDHRQNSRNDERQCFIDDDKLTAFRADHETEGKEQTVKCNDLSLLFRWRRLYQPGLCTFIEHVVADPDKKAAYKPDPYVYKERD